MILFHFLFDLNQFNIIQIDMHNDPFWLITRAAIVSLFLWLVGVSLVLGAQTPNTRFYRRWLQIVVCAGLATLGSLILFPQSYIFFGVLHCIAVALIIGRLLRPLNHALLWIGSIILVAGNSLQSDWFDQPYAQWLGFMTHKPFTEDYVPLAPWLGVVLLGLYSGKHFPQQWLHRSLPPKLMSGVYGVLQGMGQRSLLLYILHQPILIGLLWLLFG